MPTLKTSAPPGTPLGENILVDVDTSETTTEAGIQLPQAAVQKKRVGTVVAVGPNTCKEYPQIEIGSRLLWIHDIPSVVEWEDSRYLLLHPSDVALVLEN